MAVSDLVYTMPIKEFLGLIAPMLVLFITGLIVVYVYYALVCQ